MIVNVRFESLTHQRYHLYLLADPSLSNDGMHNTGSCARSTLLTTNGKAASAIVARPALPEVSCGYKGKSDGWTDLRRHQRMQWHYSFAPDGNVVQAARTALTGTKSHQDLTVALGFGSDTTTALRNARRSLLTPWRLLSSHYAQGWAAYLASLKPPPATAAALAGRSASCSTASRKLTARSRRTPT